MPSPAHAGLDFRVGGYFSRLFMPSPAHAGLDFKVGGYFSRLSMSYGIESLEKIIQR